MRPQQQNRRMRGRNSGGSNGNNNNNNNNSNRRGPNPLNRNYESNGPDVKIRGSAQQIAEKYAQLARDAHSSGDRVMAENYLQHAEHYNRIIAAAQAQMPIQNVQPRDASDDDMDEDRDDFDNVKAGGQPNHQVDAQPNAQGNNDDSDDQQSQQTTQDVSAGSGPQPDIAGIPAEVALNPEASGEGITPVERKAASEAPEGQEPVKRPRRPRRPRQTAAKDSADAPADDGGLAATLSRGSTAPAEKPAPAEAEG